MRRLVLCLFLLVLAPHTTARAATTYDPQEARVSRTAGSSTARAGKARPAVMQTAAVGGGSYVAWIEFLRDGTWGELVVLRIASDGSPYPGWPTNGLVVSTAGQATMIRALVPDGSGGMVVAWQDQRTDLRHYDLRAQRISGAGALQWTAGGALVHANTTALVADTYAGDGAGGLLAAWTGPGAIDQDVFATRLDGAGSHPSGWPETGVLVCDASDVQGEVQVSPDGANGAFLAWNDARAGDGSVTVYAQRIASNGAPQWTANGQAMGNGATGAPPSLCSDGATGAYLFRQDPNDGALYCHRMAANGGSPWLDPLVLTDAGDFADTPIATPDGSGGAFVQWNNNGINGAQVLGQHVSGAGNSLWGATGVAICSASQAAQPDMLTLADGTGGAFFVWPIDYFASDYTSLRAQHVSAAGVAGWGADGVMFADTVGYADCLPESNGAGGLVVGWNVNVDLVNRGYNLEVRDQVISSAGTLSYPTRGRLLYRTVQNQYGPGLVQNAAGGVLSWFVQSDDAGTWSYRSRAFDGAGNPVSASRAVVSGLVNWTLGGSAADGAGGLVFSYEDTSDPAHPRIYAQRVDSTGAPLWGTRGVVVCDNTTVYGALQLVPANGGFFVTWSDTREGRFDLWWQRLDASGVPAWTANGVRMWATAVNRLNSEICSDGSGGVICFNTQSHFGGTDSVLAQRWDGSGNPLWGANGTVQAQFPNSQSVQLRGLVPSGPGGAIAAVALQTMDIANLETEYLPYLHSLRLLRANGSGAPTFGATGQLVCDASSAIFARPLIASDHANGAIVAWSDDRAGSLDVRAQWVDSLGTVHWTANGAAVCTAAGWQLLMSMTVSPTREVYLTWQDLRNGNFDVYAQRLNNDGTAQWTANGLAIATAANGQYQPAWADYRAASPARLFIGWTDNRSSTQRLVYIQRLDLNGAAQWGTNGTTATQLSLVASELRDGAVELTWYASAPVDATVERRHGDDAWRTLGEVSTDGTGFVRFTDRDVVNGEQYDYRLAFVQDGVRTVAGETRVLVGAEVRFELAGAQPNPSRGGAHLVFSLPDHRDALLEVFDVLGRRVESHTLRQPSVGRHAVELSSRSLRAGIYLVRLTQGSRTATARVAMVE